MTIVDAFDAISREPVDFSSGDDGFWIKSRGVEEDEVDASARRSAAVAVVAGLYVWMR